MPWIFPLDLGKKKDFSAFGALEQLFGSGKTRYVLHAAERLPMRMPYPDQRTHVRQRIERSGKRDVTLAVDQTGVGEAVVDEFRQAELPCNLEAVLITGGNTPRFDPEDNAWHVPKKALVSVTMVMVEGGRLDLVPGLKYEDILKRELQTFTAKITTAGNEQYEAWRESDHDDLVLMLAIGLWIGENTPVGWDGTLGTSASVPRPPAGMFATPDVPKDRDPSLDVPGGYKLWEAEQPRW